jgi:NTP pyrophosphatase (non-canonical NTP hydrolase)
MTLDDYQRAALRTVNPALDENGRLLDAAAGLAEEAGEVLGLVRKQVFQQREAPRERMIEELGDALWCLTIAADTLGVSLDELAEANLRKLKRRHPDGFVSPRPSQL